MGSKASKAKRSTLTKNKALTTLRVPQDTITGTPQYTVPIPLPDPIPRIRRDTIPTIPHDIINEILDHLAKDSDLQTHRACSLISRSWVQPCQRHLFHTVRFTPASSRRWLRIFPVREESPAHYVRDIRLEIGQNARIPERFFECIPWFTDVDKMMLSGYGASLPRYGGSAPLPGPSFWKLPTSVTSLTISTAVVTLVQVRDIMAQLPNLNNLVLSGSFSVLDRRELLGIGTVLKGGFGGRLRLSGASVDEDIIDMLLEIPSGLHFAELEIYCTRSRLPPSAVRLAEACRKTIVKLSHSVAFHPPYHHVPLERSFDFSKFPNIQEVSFSLRAERREQGLPWIRMALSTLRPATSPRLSAIKLDLTSSSSVHVETMIIDMGDDLRTIADEAARVEHEFEGAVKFTVLGDSRFGAVLDSLNVLRHYSY